MRDNDFETKKQKSRRRKPKKLNNTRTVIEDIAAYKVPVQRGNKTILELILDQLMNMASNGDIRAIDLLYEHSDKLELKKVETIYITSSE